MRFSSHEEMEDLMSQIAISSWGGRRKMPFVFSEQGVAMLSGVLHSERAIKVNIQIMRVFTKFRSLLQTQIDILHKLELVEKKDIEQDEKIMLIFEFLRKLEERKNAEEEFQKRNRVGFKQGN